METNFVHKNSSETSHPLRIWPGIIVVFLQWMLRFILPAIFPGINVYSVIGGVMFGLLIIIWWAFFSRALIFDRLSAIILMIVSLALFPRLLHISMATAMMGMMYYVYAVPFLCLAFVVWAILSRNLSVTAKRITMVLTIIIATGFWTLMRTNGMSGEIHQDFAWRWSPTAEDRLLSKSPEKISAPFLTDSAILKTDPEWPGFRGTNRDGLVRNVMISKDWSKNPPVELWRRAVGPGCSSFAVHGTLLFTQEQRGEYEMVTCYNLNTGAPLWSHGDKARFWDSHAGAGPRSTPTIYKGQIFTLGATGILNVLNEPDGKVVWTHNAAEDTHVKIPGWGYTSSPVVTDSTVFVSISGEVLAYDRISGLKKWAGTDGGDSYSSPEIFSIGGKSQLLFLNKSGANSYNPSDGKVLWTLPWNGGHIIQPALIDNSDLMMSMGDLTGIKRVEVKNESGKWSAKELWTSDKLKPYFNDFVIHKEHAYGFEGSVLACIDIATGNRQWKGGRYTGEILLLAGQDLLLILSEKGELILVEAKPDHFSELAKFPAIKGKTWNHPVMAGNLVVVRNSNEMAAFRLPAEN